eukprot:9479707-Pyramimonas_sp.AAC.1
MSEKGRDVYGASCVSHPTLYLLKRALPAQEKGGALGAQLWLFGILGGPRGRSGVHALGPASQLWAEV